MQNTPDLILLREERARRAQEDQMNLIANLRELLEMAESGQIKAVCYAALDSSGHGFTVGASRGESTGLHEIIGLAHILTESLLEKLRD